MALTLRCPDPHLHRNTQRNADLLGSFDGNFVDPFLCLRVPGDALCVSVFVTTIGPRMLVLKMGPSFEPDLTWHFLSDLQSAGIKGLIRVAFQIKVWNFSHLGGGSNIFFTLLIVDMLEGWRMCTLYKATQTLPSNKIKCCKSVYRKSAGLLQYVLIYMRDLHLVLPALYLDSLECLNFDNGTRSKIDDVLTEHSGSGLLNSFAVHLKYF